MRNLLGAIACLALLGVLLGGCLNSNSEGRGEVAPPSQNVRILERGAEVDIPVPVILLGFPDNARDALEAVALSHPIKGEWHESPYDHPNPRPEPTEFSTAYTLFPQYKILQPAKEIEEAFFAMVADAEVSPGQIVLYDGNLVEQWLWEKLSSLPDGPTANTPGIVLIHGTGRLAEAHAYRYTLNNGYMDRLRAFGEFYPQLIFDISAAPTSSLPLPLLIEGDPTTGTGPYDQPIQNVGPEDADALYQLLVAASHFRMMQGPGYPTPTEPCLGITVVHAIEIGSPLDFVPTERRQNELIDQELLNQSFQQLLSPMAVGVDVKVLVLPADDAELYDALTSGNLRLYMDQNWDKYWAPHEGCEAFVSMFWQPFGAVAGGGVAYYSTQDDRRFSYTELGDGHRATYGRTDPSYGEWDWGNDVVAHETGHLLGIRHPFDIDDENAPADGFTYTFSTIWSTMSYAPENKITSLFSALDRNNFHRNHVGFQLLKIQKMDLDQGAAFETGVSAMANYDWALAATAFDNILGEASSAGWEPPAEPSTATERGEPRAWPAFWDI